nr:uncharacterized protein LOC119165217 [Rhipicephalus microplus]
MLGHERLSSRFTPGPAATMKGVATLIFLLWINLGANYRITGSFVHSKIGALSRLYRREVFNSASPALRISDLEATVHGGNRATVKWENATGPVTGYNMTVCSVSDQPRCESATGHKTSYNLHHLESGTRYQVDVYAYFNDGGDTTNGRNERIFFTTTKLPSVENLEATPLGSTSVELRWAPIEDNVTHFDIDACPAEGGACVHAFTSTTGHILGGLNPETSYKIHVRSAIEEEKELSFGPRTTVEATTTMLPGISDAVIRATCDHFIIASWNYTFESVTGFLLNLCTEGEACVTRSVDKDDREHKFKVDPMRRSYTLSMEAYLWKGNSKHSSKVVNVSVTSFPEVPRLDRFDVKPVSSSQVRASWYNDFNADVRIQVCPSQSTDANCATYVAHGAQKGYTLYPYSCLGLAATREVTTLTEDFAAEDGLGQCPRTCDNAFTQDLLGAVCIYDDKLMQMIKQISENVKALTRRRGQLNANSRDDNISAKCELIEAKLRTLTEKDVRKRSCKKFMEALIKSLEDIGPVQELSYHITNVTILAATWRQPHTIQNIAGYVLECAEQQQQSIKKVKILPESEIVEAGLDLEDQVAAFECSVWAFSEHHNGTAVLFNVTTLGLHPVTNLSFVGGCDGSLQATWSYTHKNEAGFNLTICRQPGEKCNTTLVQKNVRLYKFSAKELDVEYQLSVSAIGKISGVNVRSKDVVASAMSFPHDPGPVCNLEYKIDNVTRLVASWDGPVASVPYDGYALQCIEKKFGAVKSTETLQAEKHANITLDLEEQLAGFFCAVWAFAYNGTARNNGTTNTFFVKTNGIGPPKHVTLVERTAMSLAYSWAKDRNAPKCRVVVVAIGASDVIQDDCSSISDEELVRYNITGLTPGRGYNVSIQNCAEYCGIATVIDDHTNVAAPSVVTNFTASVTGFVNVTFTWEKPAVPNGPIDGYLIRILNEDNNVTTEILADWIEYRCYHRGGIRVYLFSLFNHCLQCKKARSVSVYAFNYGFNDVKRGPGAMLAASTSSVVPLVDSAVVRALTSSALQITWTTEWKYQIRIVVCPLEGPKRRCNEYIVDGDKYVFTITGLNASTLYEVDTTAQTTRYGMTCVGPVFEQDVTTFSMDIGPVQNLNHTVVNVTIISASWDEPANAERIDGYTITCKNKASGHSTTAEYLRSANMSVLLDVKQQLAHFNCSVNAFATWDSGRQEGLATIFEEATDGIELCATCAVQRDITELLDTKVEAVFVEHKILDLNPGTLYDVFIQNCADYCGLSTVVRNTTDVDAPSPVRELQSNLRGFSDVTLTWTQPKMPNGPIDGYIVKLLNEEKNKTDVHTIDGKKERFSVQLCDHFTYFKAHVSAYNIDHAHNFTLFGVEEQIDFVTLGNVPSLPRSLIVQSWGTTWIDVKWQRPKAPNGPVSGYNITWSDGDRTITATTNETAFNITLLKPGSLYRISVHAFNDGRRRRKPGPASVISVSTDQQPTVIPWSQRKWHHHLGSTR